MKNDRQKETEVVIVAAMSRKNHAIGRENGLLWHIPSDMKRFRELTSGFPIIMGRKTFESIIEILGGPLPMRPNIVLTRNKEYKYKGVEVATSLEEAFELAFAHNPKEIHIGGGSEIYKMALPYVDRLHLTFVDDEPESDTFFPDFEDLFVPIKSHGIRKHEGLTYEWVDYIRKTN